MYQIGEAAELGKVSPRLLRHYDEIGLLVPSSRSGAGYRLYSHADLERLQLILFYRALEFPLDTIRRLITGPGFDRHAVRADAPSRRSRGSMNSIREVPNWLRRYSQSRPMN